MKLLMFGAFLPKSNHGYWHDGYHHSFKNTWLTTREISFFLVRSGYWIWFDKSLRFLHQVSPCLRPRAKNSGQLALVKESTEALQRAQAVPDLSTQVYFAEVFPRLETCWVWHHCYSRENLWKRAAKKRNKLSRLWRRMKPSDFKGLLLRTYAWNWTAVFLQFPGLHVAHCPQTDWGLIFAGTPFIPDQSRGWGMQDLAQY